jgi:hypothetical protein
MLLALTRSLWAQCHSARHRFTARSAFGDYEEMPRALVLTLALLGLSGCGTGNGTSAGGSNGGGSEGVAGTNASGGSSSEAGASTQAGGSSSQGGAASGGGNSSSGGNSSAGSSMGAAGSAGAGPKPETGPITCRAKGDGKSTITFINKCMGTLSFRGSKIQGGDLAPGEHACRDVGDDKQSIPAIRYWGYIGQDPGPERYTLAEFTLNTNFNNFDWFNISHVDAHNLPMQIDAVDMPMCRVLSCPNSLLANCPAIGIEKDASGKIISCFDPTPNDKNGVVAMYFEAGCADAYSWSGDDQGSVVACAGEDYDITFCP